MRATRRQVIAGSGSLALLSVVPFGPSLAAAPGARGRIGEVWSMPYWAPGAPPAAQPARRRTRPPEGWHGEFV